MIFRISGYWVDDKSEFSDYLVSEFDSTPENYTDDEIFFYGLSEDEIKEAIKTKEPISDFVITSYSVVEGKPRHGDKCCTKYHEEVLPDENGNCSLCGAVIDSSLNKEKYYKIYDLQGAGIHESEIYETKEEIRQHLINYHSIDWEDEDGDINSKSLEFLLDYGTWGIEEIN